MTSPGGISSAPMLVTYPFNPTSRRARASDVSSRDLVPLVVLTNRGGFAVFSPSTTARALFSWAVRVLLSRTARFVEYAHTARHDPDVARDPRWVPTCAWGCSRCCVGSSG